MVIQKGRGELVGDILSNFQLAYARGCADAKLDKFVILGQIHQLSRLIQGWNGYGGSPIAPAIIEAAEQFVTHMPSDLVAAPQIVPMTRGRLQFEWHNGDRSLELEFESPESIHYLKWDLDSGIEEEDVIPLHQHGRILDLLKWFSAK